jgi:hypothetical protein
MKTLALGLLLVVSAYAQKVELESDQTVDFTKFKTFAVIAGRLNSKNPALNNELTRKRLNADIEKFLGAKGLIPAPSAPADLNIRYTLGTVRGQEIERW